MSKNIKVSSEIHDLKRVIIHRPDAGIARVAPKDTEKTLFDDIVYLPLMQEEHDIFTRVLRAFIGQENVIEAARLIEESLEVDKEMKSDLIHKVIDFEELPYKYADFFHSLTNKELTELMITGYCAKNDHIFFDPIPNFIFTRDIAVTINDHILITRAAKTARHRENLLTRFFIRTHPMFAEKIKNDQLINLNKLSEFSRSKKGENISMEGGDVMVINEDYVLIGCSERTTAHAIYSLRDKLFEKKVIKNVVKVDVPSDRSFMHLDTIFTQIDENHIVAFKPIVADGLSSTVEVNRADGTVVRYPTIKEFFLKEINPDMKFIYSGKGIYPYQEREQWTDSCNLVCMRSGVALTYDRNKYTAEAIKEAGFKTIHATDLLTAFDKGVLHPDEVKKSVILLPSNELSRARGGSHCMTFPVERGIL